MTLTSVVRGYTVLGIGAMLAVAFAQDTPADKNKNEAPTATASQSSPAPAAPGALAPNEKDAGKTPAAAKMDAAAPAAPTNAPGEEAVIRSHTDKLSYAAGIDLAQDLKRQGNSQSMNVELFMRALSDALAGRHLLMTDQEAAATMKEWDVEQKQDLQHAKMMIAERNRRDGDAFFADNAKKEGVVTLPSGLQYKILRKGDGKTPTLDDVVLCNYSGTLLDGMEIDSSYKRKEPTAVPVKAVIPGWMQALQIMPVGSKWQLFIPPQLAYGDKATEWAGPNASLIFEVELLSIREKRQTASTAKPENAPSAGGAKQPETAQSASAAKPHQAKTASAAK